MKFSEIIVCAAIFLLVSICFSQSIVYARRSCRRISENALKAECILETDFRIRKAVRSVKIPYWKNTLNETEDIKRNIVHFDFGKDVKVISCDEITGSRGRIRGMCVKWSLNSRIYETREDFSSVQIMEMF